MEFTYDFIPDPAEGVRASRHIQGRQRFGWLGRAAWFVIPALAALYLLTGTPWHELGFLAVAVVFLGCIHLLSPWIQRRQYRRLYRETPGLNEPQTYTFSDAGLSIHSGATSIQLGWPSIVEADESAEFFLLYLNRRCAYYLPKRAVGNAAAQQALGALLCRHLGDRAARLTNHSPPAG